MYGIFLENATEDKSNMYINDIMGVTHVKKIA